MGAVLEPFEYRGIWWLPERPDRQVAGVLTFSQDGASLELVGALPRDQADPDPETGEVELSFAASGDHDCFPRSSGSPPSVFETFRAAGGRRMNKSATFDRPDRRTPTITPRAPRASEQECLQAELVEQAELLDVRASEIRRLCADLNRESLIACGWMGDLPRHLVNQQRMRHLDRSTSALPRMALPALNRRAVATLFATTLIPWLGVALLLYVCWSLIS